MAAQNGPKRWIGVDVRRKEDARLLTGRGKFTDDIELPGMLYAAVLRSPYAHARIKSIDTSAAEKLPGVVAVLTGQQAAEFSNPLPPTIEIAMKLCQAYSIAVDKARYVGEPVAAVAAVDRYTAEDALELIDVVYEPLQPVTTIEQALAPDAPLLYEEWGDNRQLHWAFANGDVDKAFAEADRIIKDRILHHRYTGTPMEARVALADYEPVSGQLTVWVSTQAPHQFRTLLSQAVRIKEHKIRVLAPDVGGGFGTKLQIDAEVIPCLLSIYTGRPVKWTETRTENLLSGVQSRDYYFDIEIAVKNDGTILGVRNKLFGDQGCDGTNRAAGSGALIVAGAYVPGPYKIQAYSTEVTGVVTNKGPYGAYRGYGKDIANYVMERMMDRIARELNMSPVELRMKNFIQPHEFPYKTITGPLYDSGNYQECMQRALELVDYDHLRQQQEQLRKQGRYIGIGIAAMLEPSGAAVPNCIFNGYEAAIVRVTPEGGVTLLTGMQDIGQGVETTLAQVVADELGVTPEDVKVIYGDTDAVPYGLGPWSSRGATYGVSAVLMAARKVREKILNIGANLLEARAEDLDIENSNIFVKEMPSRSISLRDLAEKVYFWPGPYVIVPPGQEPTLEGTHYWTGPIVSWIPDDQGRLSLYSTHPSGTFIVVAEVDVRTGEVKLQRLAVGHDCGNIINPMIVDAQVHGGAVQGMAGALLEELKYDENGQLLTNEFVDYLVPTAADMPPIDVAHVISPSPFTAAGTKGMGEGGAIPTPAAVANAVEDALAPFGVKVELPITPEKVLRLVEGARG